MPAKPIYCIDASALIAWWVEYYPPDVFPGLVTRMEDVISAGRAIAPRSVKDELKLHEDELYKWTIQQDGFYVEEPQPVQQEVSRLMSLFHNPEKPAKGINGADPFVIAVAIVQKPSLIVVTDENQGSQENPKIPYVCQMENIKCITFLDLWRTEGWKLK